MVDKLGNELEHDTEATEQQEEKETKTYTEEELQKLLQSETDKRVSEALKTNREKLEAEFQQRLEEEKNKVKETAHMTAEEKARAEFEAEKEAWEREKAEFERQKLELATTKKLAEEGLPSEFALLVLGADEEDTNKNIEAFKEQWKNSLEKAVNERLSGTAPKTGNSRPKANMTKEEFGKLSYKERTALLEKDPNFMDKLK